ncbi:MAG: hypothetical protein LBQ66_14555 [Planctomycetaceae bacterium]|nr:hypothetical protein [Planctomycetaceae bacterium]
MAFLPNLFGFLMHRGGRDARVPVRRRFAANLWGVALCYGLFAPLGRVGFAGAFWRSRCRLAPTLFTKKAWQSIAHLTITNALTAPFRRGQASVANITIRLPNKSP